MARPERHVRGTAGNPSRIGRERPTQRSGCGSRLIVMRGMIVMRWSAVMPSMGRRREAGIPDDDRQRDIHGIAYYFYDLRRRLLDDHYWFFIPRILVVV
jgi:hypothetical protein